MPFTPIHVFANKPLLTGIDVVELDQEVQDIYDKVIAAVGGGAGGSGTNVTVRAATTANITVATALNVGDAIDGVTLADGDLVLVKNQTAAAGNGVFVAGASPARASGFTTFDGHPGKIITVQEGTTQADTTWLCTSNEGGTLDTTAIVFSSFSAAGALAQANALSELAGVAATARSNIGAAAATGGTLTTTTLAGITTRSGAEVTTANAMGGTVIDVTASLNTKSISADTTFTFSATPAAQTWFHFLLTNTDTAAHIVTFPSSFSQVVQGARTTTPIPASGQILLTFRYSGTAWNVFGDLSYLSKYDATAAPGIGDDVNDGYGPGSLWYDTVGNSLYINESGAAGAAVWTGVTGAAAAAAARWLEPSFLYLPVENSTTPIMSNYASNNLDSSVGAARSQATTSHFVSFQRTGFTSAAAAISRLAGNRPSTRTVISPSATLTFGTVRFRLGGGINDAVANAQFGLGCAAAFPVWTASAEPSAMVNCCMLAGDAGDAQLSVMHNDASGACTKETLNGGTGFPNNTNAADMYTFEMTFQALGASRRIDYIAKNLISGITASGSITTDLPVAGTAMYVFVCRGSANNAATVGVDLLPLAGGSYM